MKNSECKLKLINLYFSKYDFQRDENVEENTYDTSFQISYAVNSDNDSMIKVTIDTCVSNEKNTITLNIQAVGIFEIDKKEIDKDMYTHLIQSNTVAILFPYIRSQISLLTTQPGMKPIVLPPININGLVSEQHNKE